MSYLLLDWYLTMFFPFSFFFNFYFFKFFNLHLYMDIFMGIPKTVVSTSVNLYVYSNRSSFNFDRDLGALHT